MTHSPVPHPSAPLPAPDPPGPAADPASTFAGLAAAPADDFIHAAERAEAIRTYIAERFATQLQELRIWRTRDYGTAYNHCLIERQILGIAQALGIGLMGRTHTPAVVRDMSIWLEDVTNVAGINFQTFGTFRTEFCLIKEAHVLLHQRNRSNTLPADYSGLLTFFDVMLGECILDTVCTTVEPGLEARREVEAAVVTIQITTLMGEVRTFLNSFRRV